MNDYFRQVEPYDDYVTSITLFDGSSEEDPSITLMAAIRKKKMYLIRCDTFMTETVFKKDGSITKKKMPIVIGYKEFGSMKAAKKDLDKLIAKLTVQDYSVDDILSTPDIEAVLPRHTCITNEITEIACSIMDASAIIKIRKVADKILKDYYPYYDELVKK